MNHHRMVDVGEDDESDDDIVLVTPQQHSTTPSSVSNAGLTTASQQHDERTSTPRLMHEGMDEYAHNDPITLSLNSESAGVSAQRRHLNRGDEGTSHESSSARGQPSAVRQQKGSGSVGNAGESGEAHLEDTTLQKNGTSNATSSSGTTTTTTTSKGNRFLFQENDYSAQIFKVSWHFNRVIHHEIDSGPNTNPESLSARRRQSLSNSSPASVAKRAPLYYSSANTPILYPSHLSKETRTFDEFASSSLNYSHFLYNTSPADNLQNARSVGAEVQHIDLSNGDIASDEKRTFGGLNRNACGNYMDWSDKNLIAFSSMGYEILLQVLNDTQNTQQPATNPNSTPNTNTTPSSNLPASTIPASANKKLGTAAVKEEAKSTSPRKADNTSSSGGDVTSMSTKQFLYLMDPNEPKFHSLFVTNHNTPIKDVLYNSIYGGGNDLITYDDESVTVWSTPQSTGCINDLECQQFTKLSGIISLKWLNYDFIHLNQLTNTPPSADGVPLELHDKYEKRVQFLDGIPHGRSAWLAVTRNGMVHFEYRVFMDIKGGTFEWKSKELFLNTQFRVADIRCTAEGNILIAGNPPHSALIETYMLSVYPERDMHYSLVLKKIYTPFSIHTETPPPFDPDISLNNHIVYMRFVPFVVKNAKLVICSAFGDDIRLQEFTLQPDKVMHVSKSFKMQPKITQTRWICTSQVALKSLPTCLRFSKDGTLLCIGYLDGHFDLRKASNLEDAFYVNDSLRTIITPARELKRRKLTGANSATDESTFTPIYLCSPINGISFSPSKSMVAVADAECKIHFFTLPLYKPTDISTIVELSFVNYHDAWDIFYLVKCWIVGGEFAAVRENISKMYSNRIHRSSSKPSSTSHGKLYERFISIVARMMGGHDNVKSVFLQSELLLPILIKSSVHLTQTLEAHRKQQKAVISDSSTYQIHRWMSVYVYMWVVHWGYVFLLQWRDYFRNQQKDPQDKDNRVTNLAHFYFLAETDERYVERYVKILQSHRADAVQVCRQNANLLFKADPATKPLIKEIAIGELERFLREYISIQRRQKDSHSSHDIVRNDEQYAALRKAVQEQLPKIKPLHDEMYNTVDQVLTLHMDLVPQLRGRLAVKDDLTVLRSLQKEYLKDIFSKERMSKGISYKYCRLCSRATMCLPLLPSPMASSYQHACPACGSYWFLS